MRLFNVIVCPLAALLVGGCVTAHYKYAIAVPDADSATPAKVELLWKGGSRTLTLKNGECTSAHFSEVMQPLLCPVADIPRGLEVRVTRDGYKPWTAVYSHVDDDFRSGKWDAFSRQDVVKLEPLAGLPVSRRIDGTPIYR
jgi:hypothetical protein